MTAPMPQFDDRIRGNIQALRKAGRSDAEIQRYLTEYEGIAASPIEAEPAPKPVANWYGMDQLKHLPGVLSGVIRQGMQGVTGGFFDDLVGLVNKDAGQRTKEQLAEFQKLSPIGSAAIQGAGAMVSPIGKLAGSGGATSFLQSLGQGARAGAVYGGAFGAGNAEGGMMDRLRGGAVGAAVGGGLGAGIGGAIYPIARGAQRLARDPATQSARKISEAFKADVGATPKVPAGTGVVADEGGPNVLALLREAMESSPDALAKGTAWSATRGKELRESVGAMANSVAGLAPPTGRRVANPLVVARDLAKQAQQEAAPLYAALQKQNPEIEVTPMLQAVLGSPTIRALSTGRQSQAFADNRQMAEVVRGMMGQAQRGEVGQAPAFVNMGFGPQLQGQPKPTWKSLDLLKQRIDNLLTSDKGFALGAVEKADIRALRAGLVSELDRQVPQYAKARQAFAGPMIQKEMLEEGTQLARKGADAVEAALLDPTNVALGENALTHLRLGVLAEMQTAMAKAGKSAVTEGFWNPDRIRMLQLIATDEANASAVPGIVATGIRQQETMRAIPGRVAKSTTGAEEAELGAGAAAAAATIAGKPGLGLRYMTNLIAQRGRKMPKDVADEITRLLLSSDLDGALAAIQRYQNPGFAGPARAGRAAGIGVGILSR